MEMEPFITDAPRAKKKKKLTLIQWVAGFQCYALAADAAEVCLCKPVLVLAFIPCLCRFGSIPHQWRTFAPVWKLLHARVLKSVGTHLPPHMTSCAASNGTSKQTVATVALRSMWRL
jgi:hypothetical protein